MNESIEHYIKDVSDSRVLIEEAMSMLERFATFRPEDREVTRFLTQVVFKQFDTILAELVTLRKDAERYRWLRERGDNYQWMNILRVDLDDFASLDDAIDAMMNGYLPRRTENSYNTDIQ